jgi:archaetidylinositol phosphate synthase
MTRPAHTPRAQQQLPRKRRLGRELVVEAFFGPLADRLALALAPVRVPPTAVVLANGAAGLLAVLALLERELLAAAVVLQLKTLLDNADGRLARISGRVTLLGRYLDTEVDLLVNGVLFAALGSVTGEPWLALAAFCAVTLVLSVNFNLAELTVEARGDAASLPPRTESTLERTLSGVYGAVYGWQDALIRELSARRLQRILGAEADAGRRQAATLAYYDRVAAMVLANLGLSTQLLVLGLCLAAGVPELYLWLALASALVPIALQLRREHLARHALVRLDEPSLAATTPRP